MKKLLKYLLAATAIFATVAIVYFGNDLANITKAPVEVFHEVIPQVIIKSDFEEIKREYMESEAGQEVLDTWATQKALEDIREKLDVVEAEMLEKEASL